jgi:hypothetical protein
MLLLEPMTTDWPVAPGTLGSLAAVDPSCRLAAEHEAADRATESSKARWKNIGNSSKQIRDIPGGK